MADKEQPKEQPKKPQTNGDRPSNPGDILKKGKTPKDTNKKLGIEYH